MTSDTIWPRAIGWVCRLFPGRAELLFARRGAGRDAAEHGVYLFVQDSWKVKPSLTVNYGVRWELNTPYYDTGNRLQTFRPGQAIHEYPCLLSIGARESSRSGGIFAEIACDNTTARRISVFPLGLVFPGDKGIQRGLTPRITRHLRRALEWLGPLRIRKGFSGRYLGDLGSRACGWDWGLFYNPMEQLVLEQFSAEPPFGGSSFSSIRISICLLRIERSRTVTPNPFQGIIKQTPTTACSIRAVRRDAWIGRRSGRYFYTASSSRICGRSMPRSTT